MHPKGTHLVMSVAVAIAAGLMVLGSGRAEAQKAKITAIVLDVTHRVGAEGVWVKSSVGAQIPANSRVRTGRRSKCQITFADGSIIRMGERSDLVIKQATNVELSHGKLYAKIVAGTLATVKGATGVAAVKGTELEYIGIKEDDLELPPNQRHEILRVYAGEVLFSNDSGPQRLTAGMVSQILGTQGPAVPVSTPPAQFPGGQRQQWWGGVRPGVQVSATPGTAAGAELAEQQRTMREVEAAVIPPPEEGSVEVVVTSLGAEPKRGPAGHTRQSRARWSAPDYGDFPGVERNNALASATLPLGSFAFDAYADAATGQLEGGPEVLGKQFFGPRLGVDMFGFWAEGAAMVGALGCTSAVWDDVYLQASGLVSTKFHGRTTKFMETYAAMRPDWGEIVLGRQRFLDGPINNTAVGSLLTFDVADALRADYQHSDRLKLTGAYLEDFSPLLADDTSGVLLRAEHSIWGGALGGTWLHQSGGGQDGWTLDLALPAVPDSVDAYLQFGEDPMGRELGTVGVYFPGIYRKSGVDIFIERAWRDNLPTVTSVRAYRPMGNFDTVLMLQKQSGGDTVVGIGAVLHSGD